MARLPALIDAFVQTDGRDRSTIEHVARVIREHGLIPSTKRGTGAAAMTAREAVNLLFALNGASSPKDSVEAVQRLRLTSRYVRGTIGTSRQVAAMRAAHRSAKNASQAKAGTR